MVILFLFKRTNLPIYTILAKKSTKNPLSFRLSKNLDERTRGHLVVPPFF